PLSRLMPSCFWARSSRSGSIVLLTGASQPHQAEPQTPHQGCAPSRQMARGPHRVHCHRRADAPSVTGAGRHRLDQTELVSDGGPSTRSGRPRAPRGRLTVTAFYRPQAHAGPLGRRLCRKPRRGHSGLHPPPTRGELGPTYVDFASPGTADSKRSNARPAVLNIAFLAVAPSRGRGCDGLTATSRVALDRDGELGEVG